MTAGPPSGDQQPGSQGSPAPQSPPAQAGQEQSVEQAQQPHGAQAPQPSQPQPTGPQGWPQQQTGAQEGWPQQQTGTPQGVPHQPSQPHAAQQGWPQQPTAQQQPVQQQPSAHPQQQPQPTGQQGWSDQQSAQPQPTGQQGWSDQQSAQPQPTGQQGWPQQQPAQPQPTGQQGWPDRQPAQPQPTGQQDWPQQQSAQPQPTGQQGWPDQQQRPAELQQHHQQPGPQRPGPQQPWPPQQQPVPVGAAYPAGYVQQPQQGYQQQPQHHYQQPPQQGYQQHPYQAQQQTGQWGYGYQAMPQYPAPQFPQPSRPPRRGVPAWMWVLCAFLAVAVVVVMVLPSVLDRGPNPDPSPTATVPDDGFGQPNFSPSGTFTGEHMITTINQALAVHDRAAFFRFVEGDAVAPLTLWWDNMEVLGWTEGAFSISPGEPDQYADDTIELTVSLGAVTRGSAIIPAESDHPDAGFAYAPSNLYIATIRVTDDGQSGVLSGWEIRGTAAPWDLEPLYAVITDHAVTAGYADEQDLVDRIAPLSEEGAQWVIDTYIAATGTANAQQFANFVTEDSDAFNDWFIEDTSGWYGDRAGTMFPQRRPWPAAGMAEDIATGGSQLNAGGILTIGPNGLLYGDEDALDTIVHEFVHAIHNTNVPRDAWPGSTVMEGWATYNESLFRGQGEFAVATTYVGRMVRQCVNSRDFTGTFPTQQDFVDVDTVHCSYVMSSTIYAYAASLGLDVYAAADLALEEGYSISDASQALGGPVIDEAGWNDWLLANFGA